jgi:hypothetical protein
MVASGRAFETKLNVLLGRLLSSELGLRAISEHISRRDRPDVMIYVNGVRLVIEGSYSRVDAEEDVKRRIEEGLGDIGLALHYVEDFPANLNDSELEERLRNAALEVKLIVPKDISDTLLTYLFQKRALSEWVTGWVKAKITDVVSIINEATQFIISEENVRQAVSEIEQKIEDFVSRLKSLDTNKKVARKLYDIFYRLYGLSVGDYEMIDELIYAKAALTVLLSIIFYQSIHAEIGLDGISHFTGRFGYRLGLRKAFEEMILNVDYEPIYSTAIQVVDALPDALNLALKTITELAEEISSKRTLLSKDFSGKIYHRIVGDWSIRKNFATYFTTIPAAYLLAYLAVFTKTGVFSEYRRVKVGDLACGSGTLLTASYSAIKDFYIYSTFGERGIDLGKFHRQMLEEDLWGIDALRYAVQIASTNLALQNPTIGVKRMNTYTVPLGVENGRVTLGSLEFLYGSALPTIAAYFAERPQIKFMKRAEVTSITGGEIPESLPKFDLIIMNPPFLRPTGRGGRKGGGLFGFIVDESVRKTIIDRYNEVISKVITNLREIGNKYHYQFREVDERRELLNIGQAGEGLLFLYLASEHVKDGGKIAFVLPKSLLTGIDWFLARCLLLDKFHLEHVVLSYDSENGYNFSESTSLSETLIVARKREKPEEDEETTITVLLRKPLMSLEARALAFKILRTGKDDYIEVNGARAYIYKFSRADFVANLDNWGKLCAFPAPKLNRIVDGIFSGKLYGKAIPITLLGKIADVVGLAVRRGTFHETFKQVREGTPGAIPALIGGEEDIRRRIAIMQNAWVICKNPKYLLTASKFLVPDRIWVDTTHALALYCSRPVVCNIFFGLKPKRDSEMTEGMFKALTLWLNTTWGVLSILANRAETRGRWIELTITKWKLQPILDVTKLDEEKITRLANIFDKYSGKELRRLPEQFEPNNIDPIRKEIDKEFLETFNIRFEERALNEQYQLVYENLYAWIG